MLGRVAGVDTLGELDVLPAEECDRVADRVLDLREVWTTRSPSGNFCTLGVNAYMDLAQARDVNGSYYRPAREVNSLLRARFPDVHGALSTALTQALGMPVRFANDLAVPGFHIWTADGIPSRAGASIHFDLQYLRLLENPRYAAATGTLSFTLPIRLPAAGSSLRVWPEFTYPDRAGQLDAAAAIEPVVVTYSLGRALVHSGHLLHQIGPTPAVRPDDVRITMQGHGLVMDDELLLYW